MMNSQTPQNASTGSFFLSINREEIIGSIKNFIENREGSFVLTGSKDCGKSRFAKEISQFLGKTEVVLIDEIHSTEDSLLRSICHELNVEMADSHIFELLLDRLNVKLVESYKNNIDILLIIDCVEELNDMVLDAILKIGELEYEGKKLIQIMLVSDVEGIELIREKELEYVDLLFNLVLTLTPLNLQECKPFIISLFKDHGLLADAISDADVELIFSYTDGNPGKINRLIEHILLASHTKQIPDKNQIIAAAEALKFARTVTEDRNETLTRPPIFAGGAVVLVMMLAILFWVTTGKTPDPVEVVNTDNGSSEIVAKDNTSEKDDNTTVVTDTIVTDNITVVTVDNKTTPAMTVDNKTKDNKTIVAVITPPMETENKLDNVTDNGSDPVVAVVEGEVTVSGKCVRLKKNLNFRISPNLEAERINVLAAETSYRIISETDYWVKIKFNNNTGWVYKSMNFLEIYDCE